MLSYFYIIKFLPTSQYYIGCRYTKKLTETKIKNDLWVRYFTSSKLIKVLINKFGKESFHIVKIKIFKDSEEAKKYEGKFLKRINAKNNPKILNQSNSVFENSPELKWITDGSISTMISKSKPVPPGFREGRTQNKKNRPTSTNLKGRIHVIDLETGDRMMIPKNNFEEKKYTKPDLAYNKNRIWIYNPITYESKIIKKESIIPTGWIKGNPKRKNSVWYHDPSTQINYQLREDELPTENLVKGRYYPFVWYTNPFTKENKLCKINEEPSGFIRGRIL